jgi:hypothetical protein
LLARDDGASIRTRRSRIDERSGGLGPAAALTVVNDGGDRARILAV